MQSARWYVQIAWIDVPDAASPSTRPARYQVVGIGNALVDVIAHAGDGFLDAHGLVKGSMTLIETERAVELYRPSAGRWR